MLDTKTSNQHLPAPICLSECTALCLETPIHITLINSRQTETDYYLLCLQTITVGSITADSNYDGRKRKSTMDQSFFWQLKTESRK